MFPPPALKTLLQEQTTIPEKDFYLQQFQSRFQQVTDFKAAKQSDSYKKIIDSQQSEIKSLQQQLIDLNSKLSSVSQIPLTSSHGLQTSQQNVYSFANQTSPMNTSPLIQTQSPQQQSTVHFDLTESDTEPSPKLRKTRTKIPIISSQIQASQSSFSPEERLQLDLLLNGETEEITKRTFSLELNKEQKRMNEVQRLVHENQQLKMQLEQQKQQLNSSNRLFQELFPKSQLKSLPEKIEQLKTQFQNMEEKCYKTERILEHAQSISDSKEKINKQLKEQIVQLQKKLDSKDIELLQMSKSVRNVNQSMIPTFNESVVIKIHDRSLQQNIEYIQSQIALLNIPNANTHIDEILTIISDIIYGNGFKELQQHFRIKASDFSRFKDKMQANWQTEYDQILQYSFKTNARTHISTNMRY
ncbi:Conserved_hypothetical protein [Hexamita inflata]|uniref:Uncharacterized protein n=1 Tax=Hexamita inflata TaxID=28002 RepID=A0AA86NGS9_9EUKA|nr:Conserved hypothetical protein [Hexamita inflata]